MFHLLRTAVSPYLSLRHCLSNWDQISWQLREPPRERTIQLSLFESAAPSLS